MRGLRLRSIVCLKVSAVTGSFEGGEKRMPGRITNVYERPPSLTIGRGAGGVGHEAQAGRSRLVGIAEQHRAGRRLDLAAPSIVIATAGSNS